MAKLTITEALQEVKTLRKRVMTKQGFLLNFIARPTMTVDPHAKEEGGSEGVVGRERQAIKDLLEREVRIRRAISLANHAEVLELGGISRSIADWITWRREVAPLIKNFQNGITQQIAAVRQKAEALQRSGTQVAGLPPGAPIDVAVSVSEKKLGEEAEWLEEVLGTLDGKLSLRNARTEVEVD